MPMPMSKPTPRRPRRKPEPTSGKLIKLPDEYWDILWEISGDRSYTEGVRMLVRRELDRRSGRILDAESR